jgi:uncharacterized protein (TIGR02246 family)
MKNTGTIIGALLTLGTIGCSPAPVAVDPKSAEAQAAEAKAKDVADIKALEGRFMTAFKAKDVNAIMACYVPDETMVVFDAMPPRQYVGAQAYRKDWEGFVALFPGPIEADISDVDVTVGGGDVAYGHSIQHGIGTMKGGKKMEYTIRATDGYKKVNGQWLIAHEHISFPVDLMTGKADLNSKP